MKDKVNDFENKFALQLPKSYKNFLIDNIEYKMIDYTISEGKSVFVNHFFMIANNGNELTLEEINVKLWEEPEVFPQHFIAFATDSFGNYYCIDLNKENYGSVFFFDTEFYDEEENKFIPICKDFDVFKKSIL